MNEKVLNCFILFMNTAALVETTSDFHVHLMNKDSNSIPFYSALNAVKHVQVF